MNKKDLLLLLLPASRMKKKRDSRELTLRHTHIDIDRHASALYKQTSCQRNEFFFFFFCFCFLLFQIETHLLLSVPFAAGGGGSDAEGKKEMCVAHLAPCKAARHATRIPPSGDQSLD